MLTTKLIAMNMTFSCPSGFTPDTNSPLSLTKCCRQIWHPRDWKSDLYVSEAWHRCHMHSTWNLTSVQHTLTSVMLQKLWCASWQQFSHNPLSYMWPQSEIKLDLHSREWCTARSTYTFTSRAVTSCIWMSCTSNVLQPTIAYSRFTWKQ